MATLQELAAQVADLQSTLDNEQVEIQAAIDGLTQEIANLTDLVAQGGTAEERQAVADALAAIKSDLEATIEPPVV